MIKRSSTRSEDANGNFYHFRDTTNTTPNVYNDPPTAISTRTGTGKAAGKARESAAARQQNGARTPAAKLVGAGRKAIGLLDPAGEQEAAEEGDAGDGSAEDEGS